MTRYLNTSKFTHLNRSAGTQRAYTACGVNIPVEYVTDDKALVDCMHCKRTLAYSHADQEEKSIDEALRLSSIALRNLIAKRDKRIAQLEAQANG